MSKKIIELKRSKVDLFPDKIPLEVMRRIWNDKDNEYTDKQLIRMREWVYLLMEVIFEGAKKHKRNNIIHLNSDNNEAEKGNYLHPGEYRRAS
jgi:hypothetical protein